MKIIKSGILLFVIILLFTFSIFNGQPVKIRFFAWHSPELPLFLMLIFVFALGFAIAALWGALKFTGRNKPKQKTAAPAKKEKVEDASGAKQDEATFLKTDVPENSEHEEK